MRGRPRPDAATRIVDRLKLHRRQLRLDGRPYTVVSLRPHTDARFSTNYFHQTWHVVTDWHGARLLARLLWGLSYQSTPGTLILIDRPFLEPNPFDAEPSAPIALVPALHTPLTAKAARELRGRLPLTGPADGTVRWHTHGLDRAVTARRERQQLPAGQWRPPYVAPTGFQERVAHLGNLITFTATPTALRDFAPYLYTIGDEWPDGGMTYAEIDWPHGELQLFNDYRQRVSDAKLARREVLAEQPAGLSPDCLHPLIWARGAQLYRRRLPAGDRATPVAG